MTDTETLNEQLFCTMFSIMPNVPAGNRAANHHLSSFKDRQKTKPRSKAGERGWQKNHPADKQQSYNKKLLYHKPLLLDQQLSMGLTGPKAGHHPPPSHQPGPVLSLPVFFSRQQENNLTKLPYPLTNSLDIKNLTPR